VSLNWEIFKLFELETEEFSVASGTIGFFSDIFVFLVNSDAFTDPEDTSLKVFLSELNEIDPDEK
jgi:hypothetical protein